MLASHLSHSPYCLGNAKTIPSSAPPVLYRYSHRVKHLGFSGHHLGIAIDVAAYTLGATWNERHFTKDRTWKGTDHAASLEPAGAPPRTAA